MGSNVNQVTRVRNFYLVSPAHLTLGSSVTTARTLTGTQPAGPNPIANETGLLGSADNQVAFLPLTNTSGGTLLTRIVGWSRVNPENFWVPQLLFQASTVAHTSGDSMGYSVLGTTMYPPATWTINAGSTNSRYVDSSTYKVPGFALVDVLGCEYLEYCFTGTSGHIVNGLSRSI
jgi:hypothetical protein